MGGATRLRIGSHQVGSFEGIIHRENWYRFESRIARNTHKALDLCDAFGIRATFFVLGWVADGVAAAILTGIRTARTEIVCSIDCDCTYDPHRLAEMIPRLAPARCSGSLST